MKKLYAFSFLCPFFLLHLSAQVWEGQSAGFSETVTVFDVGVAGAGNIWPGSFKGDFSGDGWSVTPSNLLSRSTDGGAAWTGITVPVPVGNMGVSNISALNGDTAWVSVLNWAGQGTVMKTQDGGVTWTEQQATATFTNFVHFWDGQVGVAVGDPESGYPEIYTTEDGGDTWGRVPVDNVPPLAVSEYGNFAAYATYNNHIRFGTTAGRVWHSADNGHNWTAAATDTATTSYATVEGVTFRDSLHGAAYSGDYDPPPI